MPQQDCRSSIDQFRQKVWVSIDFANPGPSHVKCATILF